MAVSEKLIERLNDLLMLDHDAIEAYESAIKRMSSEYCRGKLREFQADHRRHVVDIKACVESYGGTPKDRRDVKGFFIQGMTAIQSMGGDEPALKAMHTNERITNREYEQALQDKSLPEDVRKLVQKNRSDEARHLAWIEEALRQRYFERPPSQGPGASPPMA